MTLDINRPDLTVGVVGTGAMGRGIAQVTAQGGIKAMMFDAAGTSRTMCRIASMPAALATGAITGSLSPVVNARIPCSSALDG